MTWIGRLRLLLSLLLVLALAAALCLVFNQRQRQSPSVSAAIEQPRYAIAAVAPGVVTDIGVALGDEVRAGDVLFTMTSVELQQDAVHGLKASSNDAMEIDPEQGTIVYRATADGRVTALSATSGNYLGAGAPVATIVRSTPRTVQAQFRLTPRDYGRLEEGARAQILLPDDRTIEGTVGSASVVTENGQAITRALITSPDLEAQDLDLIATDGAPVSVTVELSDSGVLAGPTDALMDALRSVGLR